MKGFCSGFLFRLIATHMFCVAILFGRDPDPTETTVGNSNAGETFEGLAVSGRIVFAGLGRGGIHIVDFSDFGAPKTIARIPTEGATRGVAVVGNSLFVADEFLGLQIFDIADPQHPKLSGSTTMPGHARGVAVDFPHVFIAAQDGGLQVFRINASGAPKRVGSCALAGNPARVAVLGQRAYTVGTGGVQLIDISEPSKPTLLMQGPPAEDVVATDHSVFSVDGKANVTELSAAFEPSIRQENSAMRLANGARIAASDELLCFTDGC